MQKNIRLLDNDNLVVDYNPNTNEYIISLFQEGHFVECYNFKNNFYEKVLNKDIHQPKCEGDIATR